MAHKARTKRTARCRARKRLALYEAQNGFCFYCGTQMDPTRGHNNSKNLPANLMTVDHFFPKKHSNGEGNNKVACCKKCNSMKSSRLPSKNEIRRFIRLYGSNDLIRSYSEFAED